jgi:hypothetical protein
VRATETTKTHNLKKAGTLLGRRFKVHRPPRQTDQRAISQIVPRAKGVRWGIYCLCPVKQRQDLALTGHQVRFGRTLRRREQQVTYLGRLLLLVNRNAVPAGAAPLAGNTSFEPPPHGHWPARVKVCTPGGLCRSLSVSGKDRCKRGTGRSPMRRSAWWDPARVIC